MKGRYKLICVFLIVISVLFLIDAVPERFAFRGAAFAKAAREDRAPDFVLKDIQGKKFKLSDQKGKPVLLIFTTTWCPSCREEIPRLKDIYARYARKGLVMVNIDIQESGDKVSRFADKYKLPYRTLLDEKAEVATTYGIRGVPSLILLDKDGIIAGGQRFIEPLIEKMLGGK